MGWNYSPDWDDIDVLADAKTPPRGTPVVETKRLETDSEFRERLDYVAGDTPSMKDLIARARDGQLDKIAEEYGLKRRMV